MRLELLLYRPKAISGQTLIEPILAIAIFGIILVPFVSAISNLSASQTKSRHQTEAVQYAREGLERAYNDAVNAEDWEEFAEKCLGTETETIGGRYTREVTFEKAQRNSDGNLAQEDDPPGEIRKDKETIKVTSLVSWTEKGQDQETELITYLVNLEEF